MIHGETVARPEGSTRSSWLRASAWTAALLLLPQQLLELADLASIPHLAYPQAGIGLACLLIFGWRALPAAIGSWLAYELLLGLPFRTGCFITLIEVIEISAAAWALSKLRFQLGFVRQRDLLTFLAIGVGAMTMLGGILWGLLYGIANGAWHFFWPTFCSVAANHATGTLAVAPLMLCVAARHRQLPVTAARQREFAVMLLLTITISYIAWRDVFGLGADTMALDFVTLAFCVWSGLRFGSLRTMVVVFCVSAIATWAAADGVGSLARLSPHAMTNLLLAIISVSTICALVAATIIQERDIAERERRLLEDRLRRAEKLESLGLLAGGIAHDFNNLLTPIVAGAEMLANNELSPEDRDLLSSMTKAGEHARALCRQMLAYAGQTSIERQVVDLRTLVSDMHRLAEHLTGHGFKIRIEAPDKLPPIEADPSQVQQAILNLVKNAAEAMQDRVDDIGLQLVEAHHDKKSLRDLRRGDELTPGHYVGIAVSDRGEGIAPQLLPRMFDPFFSTKGTGRGLGLAGTLGIAKAHGGGITVADNPGGGAILTAWFPTTDRAPANDSRPATAKPTTTMKVLVVDDEEHVRQVAIRILERAGHEVLEADSGQRAIELFEQHAADIDAVLLDLTMPEINGHETFARLKQLRRNVRVVLTSGFDASCADEPLAERGYAGFLQKPYSANSLLERLQSITAKSAT